MLTKDSFPLTHIFLCYQTLKIRKTIFTQSFTSKQTERKRIRHPPRRRFNLLPS